MNINQLLKKKGIELRFIQDINKEIKEILRSGEVITNNNQFTKNLLLNAKVKKFYPIKNPSLKTVRILEKKIIKNHSDFIIGIGGGRAIDISKTIAFELRLPLISIPTAPSHDGLISKNSSLYEKSGKRITVPAKYPDKLFIPLKLWKNSRNLKKAGLCDILSNIIALEDISLAEKINKEKFKKKYKELSLKAIEKADIRDMRKLAISLLYSGLSMEETSRYASGSEHDTERLLENKLRDSHFLHGQLAGTGALISAKIYSLHKNSFPSLTFPPSSLFNKVYLKMKKFEILEFAKEPLRTRKFKPEWLKEVSNIRPDRFNLWNFINSKNEDWKKVISEIISLK